MPTNITTNSSGVVFSSTTSSPAIISAGVTVSSAAGVGVSATSAAANFALQNNGTVSGTTGVAFAGGGSITNAVGATITSTSTAGFAVSISGGTGTIVNSGQILGVSGTTARSAINLVGGGSVTNNAGGLIRGGNNGVYFAAAGTVTNFGSIISNNTIANGGGVNFFGGGALTNAVGATVSSVGYGVFATSVAVNVINAGTVAGRTGIDVLAGGTLTNQAGGVISGNGSSAQSASSGFGVRFATVAGTVNNAGTISSTNRSAINLLAGGSVSNSGGGVITGATNGVYIAGAGSVSNAGTVNGTGTGSYGIRLTGGGTVRNSGTVNASTAIVFGGTGSNLLVLDTRSSITGAVTGGVSASNTLELSGSVGSAGTLTGLGSTYTGFKQIVVDAGTSWTLNGSSSIDFGTSIGGSGTLVNRGTLTDVATGNATQTIAVAGFVNAGTVQVGAGNYFYVATAVTSDGSTAGVLGLGANSTLELGSRLASGQTVGFGTAGTLVVDDAADFAGTIAGFDADDTLDLSAFSYDSGDHVDLLANNVLRVTQSDGSTQSFQLDPSQNYTGDYFHLASDGFGGTAVTENTTPCYCSGTAILTSRGEVAVEELVIGDLVVTTSGVVEPIRWIGRRAFSGRFLTGRKHLLPVRMAAGSLGNGLPRRDLRVSPLHAMLLDGFLVPAMHLVNGTTIVQEAECRRVEYIHVELARHDTIWAEGAASETFLDDQGRFMFHNAAQYAVLYPDAGPVPARYCAPRLEHGPVLDALCRRLAGVETAAA